MKTQFFQSFSGKMLFCFLTLAICVGFTVLSYGDDVFSVEPATVSVEPATLEVPEVGEHLTVHVNISRGEAIAGYQVKVGFDPSALRYVAGSNADYLPTDAFAMSLPEDRSVTIVAAALKGTATTSGDGTLAAITFELLSAKVFDIQLTEVILSDAAATALEVSWTDTSLYRTGPPDATAIEGTAVLPNYPNPFNPETWIPYQLAEPAEVTLTIYSANGQLVRTLALGHQAAGVYQGKSRAVYWDGRNELGEHVASGLYFYTLTAGDFASTGKMLIMK